MAHCSHSRWPSNEGGGMKSIYPSREETKIWAAEYQQNPDLRHITSEHYVARKAAQHAAEVMRERCAQTCFNWAQTYTDADHHLFAGAAHHCGNEIRALPLETNND